MSLNDLKLRTKNLVPIAIMVVTVVGMVALGAVRLHEISAAARVIIEERDLGAAKSVRAGQAVAHIPYAIDRIILNDSESPAGLAAQKDYETSARYAEQLLHEAESLLPDRASELAKFVDRVRSLQEKTKAPYETALKLPGLTNGRSLKPEELDGMANASIAAAAAAAEARKLVDDVASFNDVVLKENTLAAQDLQSNAHSAVLMLIALGAVSTLLAGGLSYLLTSVAVERPLKQLAEKMRWLASGDLSVDIDGHARRDEIGDMAKAVGVFKANAIERRNAEAQAAEARAVADADRERAAAERARAAETQTAAMSALRNGLKRLADGNLTVKLEQGFSADYVEIRDDFNAAAGKLKTALAAVAASTGAIHSSTREISTASDNLSQRTEQQAASLEETAAALEEITTTVKQSAQGAQHAADVVANADSDAKKGAVVVRKAVEAMDAIANSSNKIGQIIGVIDEIAFQTNLLALNAGVEAARAGDSGRGFAVVASEVRALAQRSAEAAKEIKSLVSNSGVQVEAGVKLVADTGKALESIITQVSEINKVVADIAAGAQQQATGLQQINIAITQMDQSTQQNATMVEESTAASHSLSEEMTELNRLMDQFLVNDPAENKLRRDLKAIAPHAFAKPAPTLAPRAQPAPTPRAQPKVAPRATPRPTKALAAAGSDWTEF